MNINTHILGYVWGGKVICLSCADPALIEPEIGAGNASVINVHNSGGFAPNGCSCDFCHGWVVEPEKEEIPGVFARFLGGIA